MLSIGPLGQLQLAEEHSSSFTQPGNDRRILFGTVILVDGHAARGRNTLVMTKVLHRDRNTVQGTTNCAVCDLGVSLSGLRQRQVGGQRRIAFQTAIEPRDTIENRSRHFDGGDLLCLNAGSDLNEIEKAKDRVSDRLRTKLHFVRQVGLIGAHPLPEKGVDGTRDYTALLDVEPGEVEALFAALDEFFDEFYVRPRRDQRQLDALNEKLKAAGKAPIAPAVDPTK